jgi:pimeloyl-ACP methyl ester carboxylesterase
VSTPPFLSLPECAEPVAFAGRVGPLAGVRADPAAAGWDPPPRGDLLLVPGFTGSKEDFIAVLEPLAAAGWRVTSFDQRGQYESPGPDDPGAYGLDGFAEDLLAVAATLLGPVHVVGHSFGGLVARQAVLADSAAFASLVMLCSGPGTIKREDHIGLSFIRDQLPGLDLDTLYNLTLAYSGVEPPPGEVGRFLRHRFTRNNPTGLGAIAGLLMIAPDRTGELAALAAGGFRVAVAYGEADDAWPLAEQDRVAAACGGSSHVIPGAGHSPAADRPVATAALLDALASG